MANDNIFNYCLKCEKSKCSYKIFTIQVVVEVACFGLDFGSTCMDLQPPEQAVFCVSRPKRTAKIQFMSSTFDLVTPEGQIKVQIQKSSSRK